MRKADSSMPTDTVFTFTSVTWQGHEFIDATRSPDVWEKTKTTAQKVGSWTTPLLIDIAKTVIKAELKKIGLA
jgi:hypothetical protein